MHPAMTRLIALLLALVLTGAPAFAQPKEQKGPGCDLANADTTVHGITLANSESTRRVLGADYKSVLSDRMSDYAWVIFASRDNKQLLRLRHHAGDLADSYMEFEVKYGRDSRQPKQLKVYEFLSGKGAKLGMTKKQVVALFGPCFRSVTKEGSEIVRYEIEADQGAEQPPLLKAANMPGYYAEYEFRSGRLVRFAFGYPPV